MKTNLKCVADALNRLNANYGVGYVGNVQLFMDGRIVFKQRSYAFRERTRRGILVGDTVHALGHQCKLEPFES